MADRWLLSQFAFTSNTTPPFHEAIAISKTGDPTGEYWVYDFVVPGNNFPDYSKFGAWPDGYYMTDRQFTNGGPYAGPGCFAFDRAKMLVGDPSATFIYFNAGLTASQASSGMIPSDFYGITPPPAGAPNVFAIFTDDAFVGDTADAIRLFNFHADFAVPANSTFTERAGSPLPVAAFDSRNPAGRADIEQRVRLLARIDRAEMADHQTGADLRARRLDRRPAHRRAVAARRQRLHTAGARLPHRSGRGNDPGARVEPDGCGIQSWNALLYITEDDARRRLLGARSGDILARHGRALDGQHRD